MSIHSEIASYTLEIAQQLKKQMERDLKGLIEQGFRMEDLKLCFYRDEPLRYSVRVENKIITDRWLNVEFTTQEYLSDE